MSTSLKNELQRLRTDFDRKASQYLDLTLSVYFVGAEPPREGRKFRQPNHTVMLWQYHGHYTSANLPQWEIKDLTKLGVRGAQISAFGLIEGDDTVVFRRMAYRAGSLVPRSVSNLLSSQLMESWNDAEADGKLVFATNSNPLAVWLNLVLSYTATFHAARFQNQTLAVDPYAASLTVFDRLLEGSDAASQESHGGAEGRHVPASVSQAAFQTFWPSKRWAQILVVALVAGIAIALALWGTLPESVKESLIRWML